MGTLTQYELAWELYQAGLDGGEIGLRVDKDRATVYRWVAGIKKLGIREFVRRKKECKRRRQPRTLDSRVKNLVRVIRKQYGWCGQKIQKELREVYHIHICLMSIYRIVHEDFTIGSPWRKYRIRGDAPKALAPRQVVQHDTVNFGEIFAYTSIDIFTKEPAVVMGTDLTAATGVWALRLQQAYFGHVDLHKSDQGSEFQKDFPTVCGNHRYARPYRKNDQSYIENFNRSLRKECLGWGLYRKDQLAEVQARVDAWIHHWIHVRWHMGLPTMQTPAQFNTSWYAERNQEYLPVAFAL
jgi:transposase InsO family protein